MRQTEFAVSIRLPLLRSDDHMSHSRLHYLTCASMISLGSLGQAWGASNDCKAEVKFVSLSSRGSNVLVTFHVKTKVCEASTGRFTYTYESSGTPGKAIPRRVQSWRASDGKDFDWTDEIAAPNGTVSKVSVEESSIESKKL